MCGITWNVNVKKINLWRVERERSNTSQTTDLLGQEPSSWFEAFNSLKVSFSKLQILTLFEQRSRSEEVHLKRRKERAKMSREEHLLYFHVTHILEDLHFIAISSFRVITSFHSWLFKWFWNKLSHIISIQWMSWEKGVLLSALAFGNNLNNSHLDFQPSVILCIRFEIEDLKDC